MQQWDQFGFILLKSPHAEVKTDKGGDTNLKVGVSALEGGGGVNTVKTLKF